MKYLFFFKIGLLLFLMRILYDEQIKDIRTPSSKKGTVVQVVSNGNHPSEIINGLRYSNPV